MLPGSSSSWWKRRRWRLKNCWPPATERSASSRFSTPGSLKLLAAGDDLVAGRLHDLVEAPHHDEREDDLAVVGLLVVAAQQLGDAPDEVCVVADLAQAVRRHGGHGGLTPLGVPGSVARAGSR